MYSVTRINIGPVRTNCYILSSEKFCVVVDPGSDEPNEVQEIRDAIGDKKLLAILFTHAHYDHVLGAHNFDVPCYIHKDDRDFLEFQPEFISKRINSDIILPENIITFEEDLEFEDIKLKVLHTPGHTWGSVCFLFDDIILSGDTLFAGCMGRTDVGDKESAEALIEDPSFENPEAYAIIIASLKILLELDDELKVYAGHGPYSVMKKEKEWIEKL